MNLTDFESRLFRSLIHSDSSTIDIGAFRGEFTDWAKELSQHVFAFEPLPHMAEYLNDKYRFTKNVTVIELALSDNSGSTMIYTPKYVNTSKGWSKYIDGWSSIYKNYSDLQSIYPIEFPEIRRLLVHQERLDNLNLNGIGFIKIDVEGAEYETIIGAKQLIMHERPYILVEIEERHRNNSLTCVNKLFESLDYDGYFILNDKLLPFSRFDIDNMQTGKVFPGPTTSIYINNFIYSPKERANSLNQIINCN